MQKPVKITTNYYAQRSANSRSVYTTVFKELGSAALNTANITANYEVPGGEENRWTPARINWYASGIMSPEETGEFATVLRWAAKEALRIDKITAGKHPYSKKVA
jgi:hypothetical protein